MNILANKYTFMFLVEAKGCNPNGDPSMGNLPRQDQNTGLGYITDVSIKNHIRGYIQTAYNDVPHMEILIQDDVNLNEKIAESVLIVNNIDKFPVVSKTKNDKNKWTNPKTHESEKYLCDRYWDVRTFGGVLSSGRNGGKVNGVVQIEGFNFSIDPIQPENITISRKCYTNPAEFSTLDEYKKKGRDYPSDKKHTFGSKAGIPYGLYLVRGTISACLAQKNGFIEDDLNRFFEAIIQMYEYKTSASKQGMAIVGPLIIFKHIGTQAPENEVQNRKEAMLGCAPSDKLYNLLSVEKKNNVLFPRKYSDYNVVLNVSRIPRGVCVGFKTYPFEPVQWYNNSNPDQYQDLDITLK